MALHLNVLKKVLKSNKEDLILEELNIAFHEIYFGDSRTKVDIFESGAVLEIQARFNRLITKVNPFIPLVVGICKWTGKVDAIENFHEIHGQLICQSEYRANCAVCYSCRQVTFRLDMVEVSIERNRHLFCSSCYNIRQEALNRRRRYISSYSESPLAVLEGFRGAKTIRPYKETIVNKNGRKRILRKNFDLHPTVHNLFLGVELEVVPVGKLDNLEYLEIVSSSVRDFAILKPDGSLAENGFEIVSIPATLSYHRECWNTFFEKTQGILSGWKERRCGMHVHFNLDSLSELTLGKMMVFVNAGINHEFITKVAGREPNTYNERVPKRLSSGKRRLSDNNVYSMRTAILHQHHYSPRSPMRSFPSHYDALSISSHTGGSTAELRIFQSNVKKTGFMKNLDFTVGLLRFCEHASTNNLDYHNFLTWLSNPTNKSSYPYLYSWAVMGNLLKKGKPKRGFDFECE